MAEWKQLMGGKLFITDLGAEQHADAPGGGFTVGSFSWNPGTEGASTYRSDMEAAVRRELLGTPLLYAGIGGTR